MDTLHKELRYQCVKALDDMYIELMSWGPSSGPRVAELGRRHCVLYGELSKEAVAQAGADDTNWLLWRYNGWGWGGGRRV